MTTLQHFNTKGLLLLCVAALLLAPAAYGVDVVYSTTGTFGSSGTNVLTGANSLKITFTGEAPSTPNADVPPATNAQFGTFVVTGPTASTPVNDTFSLNVIQTVPSSGTEHVVDTVTGTIQSVANSTVFLTFTGGSGDGGVATATTDPITGVAALRFQFGEVTYWVDTITKINAQNQGVSAIEGAIDLPEPAFYSLTGAGLAGLWLMAIRRRRQKAQV